MTKGEPHIDYSKFDTITLGNEIASKIIAKGPRPNYNATLRHALATGGIEYAVALACDLLSLDYTSACRAVHKLSITRPDDIVSPHEQNERERG